MSMQEVQRRPSATTVPLGTDYLLRIVGKLARGRLTITLPGGEQRVFAAPLDGPAARIQLVRPLRIALRVLTRGAVGFAEGYMAGDWDSPDPGRLLYLLLLNEGCYRRRGIATARLGDRLRHLFRANHRRGARRNIAYHYDLGNDFYRLWLDETFTYSCALFEHPDESLAGAQQRKYARLLDRLDAKPGDHVLEIGCGWGGFVLEAARRGLRVTGITLSEKQLNFARSLARESGLQERVALRLEDYRDVEGKYDHIVSIEMFEAVGERYWPGYFDVLARCLKPGGRIALQTITIDDARFEGYRRKADFIQRYIFPGGMLSSPRVFERHVQEAGLNVTERAFFGAHYALTLKHWERAVVAAEDRIRQLGYDERFLRMWRYYLGYCTAGFGAGRIDLMQAVLQRAGD